jgi:hypothetical protein
VAGGKQQSEQHRELQRALRVQIDASSVNAVATGIGVSREALARFLAGLPVQAGTVALIRQSVPLQREARR